MNTESIRLRAAAVFMTEDRLLVHALENQEDGKIWYIPPGGGIQYGESSTEALKREIKEELGCEISSTNLIGSFESFHTINGMTEHEISLIYEASPLNDSDLSFSKKEITEDNGKKKTLEWVDLNTISGPNSLLYPEGLLKTIEANQALQATSASARRLS